MTLNDMAQHGWQLPRGMLQVTRDEIDRRVSQTSQQLKKFQASTQLIDGKLHTVPSPEGERVALAGVRRVWDALVAPLVTRDELPHWTHLCTELFHFGPFSHYSEAIYSLLGELEASRLDKAAARAEPPAAQAKRRGPKPSQRIASRNALIRANSSSPAIEICKLLDEARYEPPPRWKQPTWQRAHRDPKLRKRIHALFAKAKRFP